MSLISYFYLVQYFTIYNYLGQKNKARLRARFVQSNFLADKKVAVPHRHSKKPCFSGGRFMAFLTV